jgi:hypothetical protein
MRKPNRVGAYNILEHCFGMAEVPLRTWQRYCQHLLSLQDLNAGDVNHIVVGNNSNIQDGVTVHVARHNPQGKVAPTTIGNNVTVGVPRLVMMLMTSAFALTHPPLHTGTG